MSGQAVLRASMKAERRARAEALRKPAELHAAAATGQRGLAAFALLFEAEQIDRTIGDEFPECLARGAHAAPEYSR
jgi:hypothetical protein